MLVPLEVTGRVALDVHDRTGDDRLDTLVGATVGLADDDVLRHVDQTPGEVARVGGTQGGIGQTLTGTVRVHEVLEHRQALAERGLDGLRDELAVRTRHQTLHARERSDLGHVARRARLDDRRDRVGVRVVRLHGLADLVGGLLPELDEVALALLVGDLAQVELRLEARGLGVVGGEDLLLGRRHEHVGHGDGDTRAGGPVEAGVLELVHRLRHDDHRVALGQVVDDDGLTLLRHLLVDERVVRREQLVEQDAAERGLGDPLLAGGPALGELLGLDLGGRTLMRQTHLDRRVDVEHTEVDGHDGLGRGRVHTLGRLVLGGRHVGAGRPLVETGQVVQARDHVQSRHGERTAGRRRQDVVRGEHEDAGLGLGLRGQREVDGHLVTVEVGVEGLTHQRVQLDRLTLDELRLERLDAETVQRGRTVEHHRVLGDDLFEHVPHLVALTLDHPLGGLDVLRVVEVHQTLHDERLEQLECHELGQTTLVQLQLRAHDDHGTTRVVDALTEQVLTEAALLALEQVGQRLERTVARARDGAAATTVVEQCVDGLLQHPLLVVDDDLGRAEVHQSLEAVVAVDHTAVQVVEVRRGEAATVELDHRAQLRRDHRDGTEHHRGRVVARLQERRDDLEALERPDLLLPLAVADDVAERLGLGLEVEVLQQRLDRLGAHAALEVLAEAVVELAVDALVDDDLVDVELGEGGPDLLETVQLTLGRFADLLHLLLAAVLHLAALVGLGALGLELGQVGLELLGARLDVGVTLVLDDLALLDDLGLEGAELVVAQLGVDIGDDVRGEVDDLVEILGRQVEQVAQARRNALEVPDVRDRRGQLDVAHPFTTHLGAGHLDATALTDDALEADALVLTAVALPVPGGAEDLLAEQALLLRLEGAVVDGLRLLDLAVGPVTDVLGGGEADDQLVEVVDVLHVGVLSRVG